MGVALKEAPEAGFYHLQLRCGTGGLRQLGYEPDHLCFRSQGLRAEEAVKNPKDRAEPCYAPDWTKWVLAWGADGL